MEKIHLLITRRGPVWRVRILLPGEPRPRWRAYRVADYPTPTAIKRLVSMVGLGFFGCRRNRRRGKPIVNIR